MCIHAIPVLEEDVCLCLSSRLKSLTCILECNATCIGIQDEEGNTPLHIAAIGKHTACLKELMVSLLHYLHQLFLICLLGCTVYTVQMLYCFRVYVHSSACVESVVDSVQERASHADVTTLNKNGQYADELLNQRVHFWTLRGKVRNAILSCTCCG